MVTLIHNFYGSSWDFSLPCIFGIIMIISLNNNKKYTEFWIENALNIYRKKLHCLITREQLEIQERY